MADGHNWSNMAEVTTKDDIPDSETIDICSKVENKVEFEDGDTLYTLRDVLGNEFDLKIWSDEADSYDCELGEWYQFKNARGDTFDEPMIESNHGNLDAQLVGNVPVDLEESSSTDNVRDNITDGQHIDIIALIEEVSVYENGDVLCTATDLNGQEFVVKLWADEASKYKLRTNQWYFFKTAKGDTYDEPMIDSNNGRMVDIPVIKADKFGK